MGQEARQIYKAALEGLGKHVGEVQWGAAIKQKAKEWDHFGEKVLLEVPRPNSLILKEQKTNGQTELFTTRQLQDALAEKRLAKIPNKQDRVQAVVSFRRTIDTESNNRRPHLRR